MYPPPIQRARVIDGVHPDRFIKININKPFIELSVEIDDSIDGYTTELYTKRVIVCPHLYPSHMFIYALKSMSTQEVINYLEDK